MNFETIASESKCFCCFKKDLNFLVKELTNIEQAFIKASKLLQKLFKNDLNKNNISLEDIHKDEFWKMLINDKHIRCILNYIKTTDSITEAKEIFNNLEEECKCGCKSLNELAVYLRQKNKDMNNINLSKSESQIDLDELIQQINTVEVKKSKKKKKKPTTIPIEDIEIIEFKKVLFSDSKNSNNTLKLKPTFSNDWLQKLKNIN
jgi:hypothetical protein